jgi:lipopolysaccharide/colanic/teichoic acid biosynthesis glycosyltransferase
VPERKTYYLKHSIDWLLAFGAFLACLPVFTVVIVLITLEDLLTGEGLNSPFFSEPRISAGRRFGILKFRILKPSKIRQFMAEKKGKIGYIKALEHKEGYPTRVGAVLRDYYIDEIPQVLNILKGDMCIVGPRPIPLENDPLRLKELGSLPIRAGLTGVHQLNKGPGCDQYQLDLEYIDNWKNMGAFQLLRYDLGIMYRTVFKMAKGEGI